MTSAYIHDRVEYLLDLCCWWCGTRREGLSIDRPCSGCGAEIGPNAQPEILVRRNGTVQFQHVLFGEAA